MKIVGIFIFYFAHDFINHTLIMQGNHRNLLNVHRSIWFYLIFLEVTKGNDQLKEFFLWFCVYLHQNVVVALSFGRIFINLSIFNLLWAHIYLNTSSNVLLDTGSKCFDIICMKYEDLEFQNSCLIAPDVFQLQLFSRNIVTTLLSIERFSLFTILKNFKFKTRKYLSSLYIRNMNIIRNITCKILNDIFRQSIYILIDISIGPLFGINSKYV